MNKTKEIFITAFALFSMFFGAGNLILPPFLGKNAGEDWFWVTLGFIITAAVIPILGIMGHARLQGTMYDFGKKVSHVFSRVYCYIMYAVAITLPGPRTASVTHEMAIEPYFNLSSLVTSSIYFSLVLIFVLNRTKILNLLGKFLTPLIILILLLVIILGYFSGANTFTKTSYETPIVKGILEGYQTFDAIAAIVVGGVLVISMNLKKKLSFEDKREIIFKAGILAGLGLLLIYGGLIYNGAAFSYLFSENATRTDVLSGLSSKILGNLGSSFLSILVALACFTTAVGIVTGTADYVKSIFKNSDTIYILTAILSCLLGIIIGQFDVTFIIDIAVPALMFVYPITIVLILLNIVPQRLATPVVFQMVVLVTFIFSIPDFLSFFTNSRVLKTIIDYLPFAQQNLGWVIPAILTFLLSNLFGKNRRIR